MEIYNKLKNIKKEGYLPFHMPGHKMGEGLFEFYNDIFDIDTTETELSDNLRNPKGFLMGANEYAAKIYGAKKAYLLTQGSTLGIFAMLYHYVKGGKVIMDRLSHISAVNAISVFGATPVWVYPEYLKEEGYTGGINPKDVEEEILKNPDACAIYITSPNYYGVSCDIGAISAVAKKYSIPLLVDQAHGAHFPFFGHFPKCAIEEGAAACVVSTHKTLPAPTQTAILLTDGTDLQEDINLFMTTSPSFLLLAYTEIALRVMEERAGGIYEDLYREIKRLFGLPGEVGKYTGKRDFTRLVIPFSSGYEAQEKLVLEYKIIPEMADLKNLVFIINIAHTKEDLEKLKRAVESLPQERGGFSLNYEKAVFAITPKEAREKAGRWVSLDEAAGKISKNTITSYPPGTILIASGDKVLSWQVENAKRILNAGGNILGIEGGKIEVI